MDALTYPVPAVFEFLPYRRRDNTSARDESTYPYFARAGYAGVRVDMRGTGDSDGLYDDEYSETELADAEAIIGWIASQPWCNGAVGMMGISWGGFNALQVAARRPPALKAVISIASTVDRYNDDIHYRNGCHLGAHLNWAATVLGYMARPPDSDVVGDRWREMWFQRLEALEPPSLTWVAHQRRDWFWKHGSICEDFAAVEAAALVIAGWGDGYRNTPLKALEGLTAPTKAIIGPWVHKYPHFAVPRPRIDFHAEALRWWDRWLGDVEGVDDDVEALPPQRAFIAEAVTHAFRGERERGRWVARDPRGDDTRRRLFLSDERTLAEAPGGTQIVIDTPQTCGADGGVFFVVDPATELPVDQRTDDELAVVFETPPLTEPIDVLGRSHVSLLVAVDQPQANLIARLEDVHPDGAAHRVAMGMLNLSHRVSNEFPIPMKPGEPERIVIDLDDAGYRFLSGHRLRLALSTTYFPMVLPPPVPVRAIVSLGEGTYLDLPTPTNLVDIDLPEPADDLLPVY
ncbi:MAG TPA: CocE/NonD family hydrolase, partial [Ilumatobacteraceae bacterium]